MLNDDQKKLALAIFHQDLSLEEMPGILELLIKIHEIGAEDLPIYELRNAMLAYASRKVDIEEGC